MQELETLIIETETGFEINPVSLSKLKELKEIKDKVDKELKDLTSSITNELKKHYSTTQRVGNYNFVVKGGNYETEFDLEAFKRDHLELYVFYSKPVFKALSYQLASAERIKKNVQ